MVNGVLFIVTTDQQDSRIASDPANLSKSFHAIEARHCHVQNNCGNGIFVRAKRVNALLSIIGQQDRKPKKFEDASSNGPHAFLVVDHQNCSGAAPVV